MATANLRSIGVILKLNNGVTPTGTVRTVNVALGGTSQKINTTVYNTDLASSRAKAYAIASAIEACLEKSVYYLSEETVNSIAQ